MKPGPVMVLAAAAASIFLAGCHERASVGGRDVRVGVASSLVPRMERLAGAYTERWGGTVVWTAGPSGRIANQAAAGAGFDAVVLAVPAGGNEVGRVVGRNTLAVVRRPGAAAGGRWVLAETSTVPLGIESRRALAASGRWDAVAERAVYAGSASQVVAWLRAGEADAGVVYASDVSALGPGWAVEALEGSGVVYVVRPLTQDGAAFAAWLAERGL